VAVTEQTTVKFEISEPGQSSGSGRSISFRETKSHRVNRVTQLFAAWFPLTFISAFAGRMASAFASGKMVEFPDGEKSSREAPHVLLCPVCNKYHGQPTKDSPQVEMKNLYRNAIWTRADGHYISLSQTCIELYLLPLAKQAGKGNITGVLKGLDAFSAQYPSNVLSTEYKKIARK